MTEERWKRVADLYESAQEKSADEQAALLREAAADDSGLRREVQSLLAADRSPGMLDEPLAAVADALFADNSPVQPGQLIGHYRVESLLGVGGMGEVYRARDTKLNRDVAIKILPPAFADDPERLARFKREAHVLAALNHPNIASIHGLEENRAGQPGDVAAIVMEVVEGPTLAEILAGPGTQRRSSALPIADALSIAGQIANALEAAHEQGIIHRDLKPANIKVREDGTVKVLDFGLAKIAEPTDSRGVRLQPDVSASPTITTPAMPFDYRSGDPEHGRGMTAAGVILGTAAYMSPEQAKGKAADRRSDIWAFGCVLYEMLTGTRPFRGEDVSDTLAEILKSTPKRDALPADTPASIKRLLVRCLQKDRSARLQHIGDARLDIDDALREPAHAVALVAAPASVLRPLVLWIGGAALLASAVAIVLWAFREPPPEMPERRLRLTARETRELTSLALSPDGSKIVYVGEENGRSQLWVRDLVTGTESMLPGTERAVFPFWKPNSASVGFFALGRLKRIDIAGGQPRDLAPAPGGRFGGVWGMDGTILFVPSSRGFARVSENAGPVEELSKATSGLVRTRAPVLLPDGQRFLCVATGVDGTSAIYVGHLDGSPPRRLLDADAGPVLTRGHILFARGSTLFAQVFDDAQLAVSGEPFVVSSSITVEDTRAALSADANGNLVFRTSAPDRRQLVWFDRSGNRREAIDQAEVDTRMLGVSLSRDGSRVATAKLVSGSRAVWVWELLQGVWTKITTSPNAGQALFSPDGRHIAMISGANLRSDIYLRQSTQGGDEENIHSTSELKGLSDWTSDSAYLIFNTVGPESSSDVWALRMQDRKVLPLVTTPASDADAQVSPDRRWIAYQSDYSNRSEIYIQPFLGKGEPLQVSKTGGAQVRWSDDGRELFYIDLDEQLTAVSVAPGPDNSLKPGQPIPLFRVRVPIGAIQPGGSHQQYAVASKGTRFLVNTLIPSREASPITLVLNWKGQR